jgi:uncharacterized protein YbjQ (UPF0145 family)
LEFAGELSCDPGRWWGTLVLFGGNISIYTTLCEQARADAFNLCTQHAEASGANALVAVRYDATEVAPGVTEVLCYGTAVVVEPVAQ